MKLNPLVLIAAAMLLGVAITLFLIGQDAGAVVALTAGVALLVPSTQAI